MPGLRDQNQKKQTFDEAEFAPEIVSVGMPWRLMIFSFVLFLFSAFVFFGLKFGYGTFLDSQISVANQKLEDLTIQVSEGEQEEFLVFYSQLANLETVLNRKGFSRNVFKFLEKNTLPLVFYTEADYEFNSYTLKMTGRTASMKTFVEQLTVLDNVPEVERVILEKVSHREDEVTFNLGVVFVPEFFDEIR